MKTIKPVKIGEKNHENTKEKLTSIEMGKLWAIYCGNTMAIQIIRYYLQHVEDEDIKHLLEDALALSKNFLKTIKNIFTEEKFPIPVGFSEKDVNLNAPRLFQDEFYVHYLKYTAKAGLSVYTVGLPLMFRQDVRKFFLEGITATQELMERIKDLLIQKEFIIKPPHIPYPEEVKFVKGNFLNGYIGHVRPLHGMEIGHLYDNIENNATSNALLVAFSQVTKKKKLRELFLKGKDITHKSIQQYSSHLTQAGLPSPGFINHLVTTSTTSPFSDKIMLFHKVDMFSMKIRAIGNSMSVNGRHDIGFMYTKAFASNALFVEEAARMMIENGWFEQPPEAFER